jgi:hypothetical protein
VPIREVVSQISPPIRILLVLTVAVLGAYMLFLRPKAEEIPPVEPAGTSVSKPGQVRDAAEDAVEAANGQLAQQESVDGVDAGEAAAGTAPATKAGKQGSGRAAAVPAEDLKGLPKPVRKAIRADKVLVMLFSNGKSYDDKAVEKAVAKVNRWDGRVYVDTAPLRRISKYGRIARGVNVEQSPTVVVADHTLRAETLVGYVDRATIDQAVVDARRFSNGMYRDAYLKAADKVCFQYSNRIAAIPHFYADSPREADARYAEADRVWPAFVADYKAIDAPPKWRRFHNAMVADMEELGTAIHQASVAITPTTKTDAFVATFTKFSKVNRTISKRADKRLDAQNLHRCGSHF